MPWVGFELTISVFERAKTVHALNRAAAMIGYEITAMFKNMMDYALNAGMYTAVRLHIYTATLSSKVSKVVPVLN
jgi:hypothetical protein